MHVNQKDMQKSPQCPPHPSLSNWPKPYNSILPQALIIEEFEPNTKPNLSCSHGLQNPKHAGFFNRSIPNLPSLMSHLGDLSKDSHWPLVPSPLAKLKPTLFCCIHVPSWACQQTRCSRPSLNQEARPAYSNSFLGCAKREHAMHLGEH